MTHGLLQEGHLRGRKEVAIPIGTVKDVNDDIRVDLAKAHIGELPAIDIQHPKWD